MTAPSIDIEYCEALIHRVCSGDSQAHRELVGYLWPIWMHRVRTSRYMGTLARSEDHVRNVVVRLLGKVNAPDSEHFNQYVNWRLHRSNKTFEDWTRIVVANHVRSYVREILGVRSDGNDDPSPKRFLNEFTVVTPTQELGTRPPYTAAETARELIAFARSRLSADQLTALGIWLEGGAHEEVEQRLSLPAGHGKRLLRAAIAVLRRQFGSTDSEDDLFA